MLIINPQMRHISITLTQVYKWGVVVSIPQRLDVIIELTKLTIIVAQMGKTL